MRCISWLLVFFTFMLGCALGRGIYTVPACNSSIAVGTTSEHWYGTAGTYTVSTHATGTSSRRLKHLYPRADPYPQWLIDLAVKGSEKGWFSKAFSSQPPQPASIGSSTLTAEGGPVPTEIVSDTSPQPPRPEQKRRRSLDLLLSKFELAEDSPFPNVSSWTLRKRQELTPDEQRAFQIAVFKLYVDTLALGGNNLTALCGAVNVTALDVQGIDGAAASSYLCAKATAPATSTVGSITVAASDLSDVPLNTTPVTDIPTNSTSTTTPIGTGPTSTVTDVNATITAAAAAGTPCNWNTTLTTLYGSAPTGSITQQAMITAAPEARSYYRLTKRFLFPPTAAEFVADFCASVTEHEVAELVAEGYAAGYETLCLGTSMLARRGY